MSQGSIFTNNRTQNVRLPADMRFPETVKSVTVRAVGHERILSPVENTWDSFFLGGTGVSDDFLTERADQHQSEREAF
jgi:antitoxin VapB